MAEGGIDHAGGPVRETGAPGHGKAAVGRRGKARRRGGLRIGGLLSALGLVALGLGLAALVLAGRPVALPVWAVAGIESRLNAVLAPSHLPPGTALSLGGVEIVLDRDLAPRLVLRDLRLVEASGHAVLALPEARVTFDGAALLHGRLAPAFVRLTGARLKVVRDGAGRLSLSLGGLSGDQGPRSAAEVFDAIDRMFAAPALAGLERVEGEGLALTLADARAGRNWEIGDGRLVIENRPGKVVAELGLTLLDGAEPAQARLQIETSRADSSARLRLTMDRLAAADLAPQAPPLAPLALLDAPISGELSGELAPDGEVAALSGQLSIGRGSLRPAAGAPPVPFDSAELALSYIPEHQRLRMERLVVDSPRLRLAASGTLDLQDGAGAPAPPGSLPGAAVVQVAFSEAMVDPEGVFESPARFDGGSASLRLRLAPFAAEIGEVALWKDDERLSLSGRIGAAETGWEGALDVALNHITAERLIRLWPVSAVPKTRGWLAENLGQGEFSEVRAGLRFSPGAEPRFALGYRFAGAEVRVIRTLPPVRDGSGRAVIVDNAYTVVVEGGHVTAPEGGEVIVAGTVFRVPDITIVPAPAEVRLVTDADLTATLSLLDQEPFHFVSRAGQVPALGQGRARITADLGFPLAERVPAEAVRFDVTGTVRDFRSDLLVPGRHVEAPEVAVRVDAAGMAITGSGTLDGLPLSATWEQAFGPAHRGRSRVHGTARLSDARLRALGVNLPKGWLAGETTAGVELRLVRDQPAELELTSSLQGARLAIPALGWAKPAATGARLRLSARLGPLPEVTSLHLAAPGLLAEGRITTRKGGGIELASFSRLQAGKWLDATIELRGTAGGGIRLALTGGTLDLPARPSLPGEDGAGTGTGTGEAGTIDVRLDRLVVSSGIALTGFGGAFRAHGGGLDGRFTAQVNGAGRIAGTAVPWQGATAVRITSDDAGRVLKAAGILESGRGGTLDMTLQPRGGGRYRGSASFRNLSVRDAPTLAALLSAASVVGLLEQLNGRGIMFSEGDVLFDLKPAGVEIIRGAAVGASMGLSFAGVYLAGSGRVDIEGTISPIYLLNGIGQILAPRRGEGLFGFNYRLTGPARQPQVSVNPLSILTPGMFREIFRRPPPRLKENG